MSLFSRDNQYMVWGGSWAIRRDIFDQIGLHRAWEGTLSDDLVASRELLREAMPRPLRARLRQRLALGRVVPRGGFLPPPAIPHHAALHARLVAGRGLGGHVPHRLFLRHARGDRLRPSLACPWWRRAVVCGLNALRRDASSRTCRRLLPRAGRIVAGAGGRRRLGSSARWAGGMGGPGRHDLRLVRSLAGDLLPAASARPHRPGRPQATKPTTQRLFRRNPSCTQYPRTRRRVSASLNPQIPNPRPCHSLRVVLWDTRKLDVSKDFAGGFGIGQYCGDGSFRSRVIRHFYKRDRRPSSLLYAYLAAIFARLGYRVEYAEDGLPGDADLYVFNPSLLTLPLERDVDRRLAAAPAAGAGAGGGDARLGATWHLRRPRRDRGQGRGGATPLEARRGPGPARRDRAVGHFGRPRPPAHARLVAVLRRRVSASATISRDFPRAWSSPAAAAR